MPPSIFKLSEIIPQWISPSIALFSVMAPFSIFMASREWLDDFRYWKRLLLITGLIALSSLLISFLITDQPPPIFLYMLYIPMYSICLYRILLIAFVKLTKRLPIDTSFNYQRGLFLDRWFNIIYFILSVPFPTIVVLTIFQS